MAKNVKTMKNVELRTIFFSLHFFLKFVMFAFRMLVKMLFIHLSSKTTGSNSTDCGIVFEGQFYKDRLDLWQTVIAAKLN